MGLLIDPFKLEYAIIDRTQGFDIVVDNIVDRVPTRKSVGTWYAPYTIKDTASPGEYAIKWFVQETAASTQVEYENCFTVVKDSTITKQQYPEAIASLLMKLRIRLADDNPDFNYRFAPPRTSSEVNTYTTNHGFLWQDYQLLSFLQESVDKVSYFLRNNENLSLASIPPGLQPLVVDGAALFALEHMVARWVQDEYGYSLNGISLDLSKSDKYDRMLNYYRDKVENDLKHLEEHRSHTIKGLRQTPYSHGYGYKAHYAYRGGAGGSWRRGRRYGG